MKQNSLRQYCNQSLFWLIIACLTGLPVAVHAQSAQPPVRQWQRVPDGSGLTQTTRVQAAKTGRGTYGILAGNSVAYLSMTGEVIWSKPVPGSYADSSTNRIAIQESVSLALTPDGGFAILARDVAGRYYVTKLDSAGNSAWTKTIARPTATASAQITENALTAAPDGGFLVVGSFADKVGYLTLTRLSAEGYIVGQWRISLSGLSATAAPFIQQIIAMPNQGYLLAGRVAGSTGADSQGIAIQLDKQYKVVWQRTYPALTAIQAVVANPVAGGTYIAVGSGANKNAQAITLAPNKAEDGTVLASLPGVASVVSLVTDAAGNVTILDADPANNGDFRLTNGQLPNAFRWTKSFGGSGTDVPTGLLATDDGGYLVVGTTTSTDGDVTGKTTGGIAPWVLKLGTSAQVTTLRLLTPTYNCQTGFIRFQTSGGDGSPITYSTPGIGRANTTDTFGTVDPELRSNPKVIVIQASQSGQTVSYSFDLGAQCATSQPTAGSATTDTLRLIAPTYNCQTGALTFHTTGGDGTPIEYAATGITDWTRNPNQFVEKALRTAYTIEPLPILARQNGYVASYRFDIKAVCGRARQGVAEPDNELTVRLLGNPVHQTALIDIAGVGGQSIELKLVDGYGRLIEQREIERAGNPERQSFGLQQQGAGTFLLHTTVNGQTRILKILKQ